MYVLEVMSGPLDGTQWRFEQEIVIGRDEAVAGACISIDRYLSRSHATIRVDGGVLRIDDLSSRNGTTIDGEPIQHGMLPLERRFVCGRTLLRVVRDVDVAVDTTVTPLARVNTVADMQARRLPRPVGFVPTMGALHAGHLALIDRAVEECESVVVSIFVNPLQFAAHEDFSRYPRTLERDCALLADRRVSLVFTPSAEEFYAPSFTTTIDVGPLTTRFEGMIRPTHFRGVATVVAKLLHIVAPSRLYLGQKDAQQLAVIRRLVDDLSMPVEIVAVPIMRDVDGLALSSRNRFLSREERQQAPSLIRGLRAAVEAYLAGRSRDEASEWGRRIVVDGFPSAEVEYLDVVDARTFLPLPDIARFSDHADGLAIGAVRCSAVRLLDNVPLAEVAAATLADVLS